MSWLKKCPSFCQTSENNNQPTKPPYVLHSSTSEEMDSTDGGKSDPPEPAARRTTRSSSTNRELWALGEGDKPAPQDESTSFPKTTQTRSRSLDSSRRDDGRAEEKDIAKETSRAIKAAVPTAALGFRDPEHDQEDGPVAASKKSHSDAGKNDASHDDADEAENTQSTPSASLAAKSSGVKDITSDVAASDMMREVSLKTQRESRKDDRAFHSPRESDVISKGDEVAESRYTRGVSTNDDQGKDNGKGPMRLPPMPASRTSQDSVLVSGSSSKLDTKGSSSKSYQGTASSRPDTGAIGSSVTRDIMTTRATGSSSVNDAKTHMHPMTTSRFKSFVDRAEDEGTEEDEISQLGSSKQPYDRQSSPSGEVSETSSQVRSRQQHAVACFEKLTEAFEKTYNTANSLIHSISACTEDGPTVKGLWKALVPLSEELSRLCVILDTELEPEMTNDLKICEEIYIKHCIIKAASGPGPSGG